MVFQGYQETITIRYLKLARKNWATRMSIQAGWRLIVSRAMAEQIANKLGSASRVANLAPSESSAYSDIPKGEATGNLEVRTQCSGTED